jgi:hypothetical protein
MVIQTIKNPLRANLFKARWVSYILIKLSANTSVAQIKKLKKNDPTLGKWVREE